MLIRLTRHCTMGCSHCMVDCRPDGRHMTEETLEQAIRFAENTLPAGIVVTGGEPLEHPEAERFIARLASRFHIIVCTNGERLTPELAARIPCSFQVVNDARYYPRPVDLSRFAGLANVMVLDRIQIPLIVAGRASTMEGGLNKPSCFNLRSFTKNNTHNMVASMLMLALQGRSCTPVVDWDGSLLAGELASCQPFGHVSDQLTELSRKLAGHGCRACGLDRNLEPAYRDAVWRQ